MLTFPNVTPEVFALVLDQLRTEATVTDIPTMRSTYKISGNGVEAVAALDAAGVVHVQIDHKPFYVPESMIASKIRDAITLAQQAVAKAGQGGTAA